MRSCPVCGEFSNLSVCPQCGYRIGADVSGRPAIGQVDEPPPEGGGGGGSSYTGPLDIQGGAVVAYSAARALSSAMRGQPVYTIREDAGDTEQSFSSDATTGLIDASSVTAFLDGANGFVPLWNDQSGNANDQIQATAARQALWTTAGPNGSPGVAAPNGVDAVNLYITAGSVSLASGGNYTVFAVVSVEASGGKICGMNYSGTDGPDGPDWTFFANLEGLVRFEADNEGFSGGVGSDGNYSGLAAGFHLVDCTMEAIAGSVMVDGNDAFTDDGGYGDHTMGAASFPLSMMNNDAATTPSSSFFGTLVELVFYDSILSAPDRLAIRQNIAAYYGITLS